MIKTLLIFGTGFIVGAFCSYIKIAKNTASYIYNNILQEDYYHGLH